MEAPPHEYPHTTHCYKLSVQIGVLLLADVVTGREAISGFPSRVDDSGLGFDGKKDSDSYRGTASQPCRIGGQI